MRQGMPGWLQLAGGHQQWNGRMARQEWWPNAQHKLPGNFSRFHQPSKITWSHWNIIANYVCRRKPRPCINVKMIFPGMGVPIIKMRQLWDCLIFIKGIHIPVSLHWIGPWKKKCATAVSTVPVDICAPSGARPSAGKVITKFKSCIYIGLAFEGFTWFAMPLLWCCSWKFCTFME